MATVVAGHLAKSSDSSGWRSQLGIPKANILHHEPVEKHFRSSASRRRRNLLVRDGYS
jgi:hypothetical protein